MNPSKLILFLQIALMSKNTWGANVWVRAEVRELRPNLVTSATVTPAKSEVVKVGFNSMLTGILVKVGQKVKAGELIATSDVGYMQGEKSFLESRRLSVRQEQKQAQSDYELAKKKQLVMNVLAAKDIIPRVQAEKNQVSIFDVRKSVLLADAAVKSADAEVEEVDKKIKQANYYAPIDGVVSWLIIDPRQLNGSLLADYGSVIAKIDEPNRFIAWTELMDTQVVKIQKGKKAQVQLEGNSIVYEGTVTQISSVADPKTQLFKVGVEFRKDGQSIPTGVTARVTLQDGSSKRTLSLPWNAVHVSGESAWVIPANVENRKVSSSQGSVDKKTVKLGLRTADRVEVLEGVTDGELFEAELW